MTPVEAAQVRAIVWTQGMRHSHETTPRADTVCACQYGPTNACSSGSHSRCHRAEALPTSETHIIGPSGGVACHPTPYTHPTPSACGPQRTRHVQVWLADRVCRWVCECDCHTAPAAPVQTALF